MLLLSYVSFFFCSTWLPLACRPGSLLLTPTAVCAFHPQLPANILFYSTPTSVPWHLFHQLLQPNSLIYTFTTFTTQYSPFLFTSIHIIAHHPASLPSTQSPRENTRSTGIEIPIKIMNKFYRCLLKEIFLNHWNTSEISLISEENTFDFLFMISRANFKIFNLLVHNQNSCGLKETIPVCMLCICCHWMTFIKSCPKKYLHPWIRGHILFKPDCLLAMKVSCKLYQW